MIARIYVGYHNNQERLKALTEADWAYLHESMPDIFRKERPPESYPSMNPTLTDMETQGALLASYGIEFEVKAFPGTRKIQQVLPTGVVQNFIVKISNITLLSITRVEVLYDCCTDELQRRMDDGWRILCVCPPNDQRRPDYIIGFVGKEAADTL